MLFINKEESLTFDDILLTPKFSAIKSRENVNLKTRLYRNVYLDIPIISANMDTITEEMMMGAMASAGGLGIVHRFMNKAKHIKQIQQVYQEHDRKIPAIISVGIKDEDLTRIELGKNIFDDNLGVCIDVAHGHHQSVLDMIAKIRDKFGDIPIIAGNVCTWMAANELAYAGADAIKVGVGGGSVCVTRGVTGCGVAQLQAILDCVSVVNNYNKMHDKNVTVISDGGIKSSGDIVKALAAGVDTVMLGSLLAGTDETPGELINVEGKFYKKFRGMASTGAMSTINSRKKTAEGVECLTPSKGSVYDVIQELCGGIKSGLSYLGCDSIEQLHKTDVSASRITINGFKESVPHSLDSKGNIKI